MKESISFLDLDNKEFLNKRGHMQIFCLQLAIKRLKTKLTVNDNAFYFTLR